MKKIERLSLISQEYKDLIKDKSKAKQNLNKIMVKMDEFNEVAKLI